MKNTITYSNNDFSFRNIFLKLYGIEVTISTIELDQALINEYGDYNSEEARILDEQIYCFVDKNELELPEGELLDIINNTII